MNFSDFFIRRPIFAGVLSSVIFIVGHVLKDNRLSPAPAVGMNLIFLNLYDQGQAHTEGEHRTWLTEAGFLEIDFQYGAARAGASIVVARKAK